MVQVVVALGVMLDEDGNVLDGDVYLQPIR